MGHRRTCTSHHGALPRWTGPNRHGQSRCEPFKRSSPTSSSYQDLEDPENDGRPLARTERTWGVRGPFTPYLGGLPTWSARTRTGRPPSPRREIPVTYTPSPSIHVSSRLTAPGPESRPQCPVRSVSDVPEGSQSLSYPGRVPLFY